MFSSKRFNLIIVSVALIIGIGSLFVYFFFVRGSKEATAWFDDTWHYRAPVVVTNGVAGDLENFQVAVTIDTAALITAGKIQATCADLRFTNLVGKSLPYWIEPGPGCNSATTKVWVKVDVLPKDGSTLYMYYGNPGAPDSQKGESVFEFFDDFSTETISSDKWVQGTIDPTSGTGWTQSGGLLRGGNNDRYIQTIKRFTGNYAAETRVYEGGPAINGFSTVGFYGSSVNSVGILSHNGVEFFRNDGNWGAGDGFSASGQWVKDMVSVTGTAAMVRRTGETGGTWNYGFTNSGILNEVIRLGSRYDDVAYDQNYVATWDYVFVRKAAATAPTVGSPGTEEKGTGPVGWWKFDEGSGNTVGDSSGNGNTGTIVSTAIWKNEDSCKSGKCMSFDGTNGYVNAVHSNTTLDITDKISISTWVKFNALTGTIQEMLTKSGGYYWIGINKEGSSFYPYFLIYNGTNRTVQGKTIIATGIWYHIAGTWDKDEGVMRLYVNGKSEGSLSGITAAITSGTADLLLGGDATVRLNGLLDDTRVYNYARTAAEVKRDYASGLAGKTASGSGTGVSAGARPQDNTDGLVGWWKMDETSWNGSAGEVIDSSGAGNNGTSCAGVNTSSTARYGRAGEFDGSATCVVLSNSPIAASTNLTAGSVFAWVKTGDNTGNIQGIAVKQYAYGMFLYSGMLRLYDWTTSLFVDSGVNIADNNWHYVGFTFQDGVANGTNIYIDGTFRLTTRYSILNQSVPFAIGAGTNSNAQVFNGLADDVKLWNRVRSAEQIRRDFETGPPPVMHLKMDEGSGTQANDDSGNGNKGVLVGSTLPAWTNGKYGKALSFDGSTGYVRVDQSAFSGVGNYTISAWTKISSNPTTYTIFDEDSADGNHEIRLEFQSCLITFTTYENGYGPGNQDTKNLCDNKWHYITVIKSGTTASIYIDGALRTSVGSHLNVTNTDRISVGALKYGPGVAYYLKGLIDDVRAYNYARTQKQVIEDMNAGHPAGGSPVGSYGAYWKFDEGNNAYAHDAGPNENTCSFVGGASSTPQGKFGSGVKFLSTGDYLDCGTGSSLNITGNQITLSTWIKPSSPSTNQGILIKGPLTSSQGQYVLLLYESKIYFRLNGATGGAGEIISKTSLSADTWYHIVGTYDGTNQYLYINGVLNNKKAFTDNINDSAGDSLKIGVYYTTAFPFLGTIDETRIYPYALSAAEIKTEYNRGAVMTLGVSPTSTATSGRDPGGAPPIIWWKFDEGNGTVALDSSGNGNNGTLGGATIPAWNSASYCKKGGCLSFDGSTSYVTKASYAGPNLTDEGTLEAWVRSPNDPFDGAMHQIGAISFVGANLVFAKHNNNWLYLYDTVDNENTAVAPTALTANRWHHFVGVWKINAIYDIYIDGVKIGGTTSYTHHDRATTAVTVGSGSWGYWKGLIDDVKVYNYARTPAQIAYDYNKGAPVGWWKFDEGQGYQAKDASGNANNGALTSFPTDNSEWVAGKWNKALSFDGSTNYVLMSSSAGANASTQDHTYSAWVYRTKNCAGAYCWVINNGDNSSNGSSLIVGNNKIGYFYSGGAAVIYGKTDVADNAWHHIAVVYNSTTNKATFYLDSKSDGTSSALGAWSAATAAVAIGRWGGNAQHYFGGRIDDARIYNYALSAEQIKQVYNNGAAVYFK